MHNVHGPTGIAIISPTIMPPISNSTSLILGYHLTCSLISKAGARPAEKDPARVTRNICTTRALHFRCSNRLRLPRHHAQGRNRLRSVIERVSLLRCPQRIDSRVFRELRSQSASTDAA